MVAKITDVAKRAGVSISTVSLVLNNKDDKISKKTAEKVRQAAMELNYYPNQIARSLVGSNLRLIGLIIPDLMNPYYNELAQVIVNTAETRGYSVVLIEEKSSTGQVQNLINSRLLAGALVISNLRDRSIYTDNIDRGFPIIFVDDVDLTNKYDFVTGDNFYGGYIVADYFIRKGHDNFIFISGPDISFNALNRLDGFKTRLNQSQIPLGNLEIVEGNYSFEGGYRGIKNLESISLPVAIFGVNDITAYGALRALEERNIGLSESEASIIGYDNLQAGNYIGPKLTTVDQNFVHVGKRATEGLIDKLETGDRKVIRDIVRPIIVEKKTVFRR